MTSETDTTNRIAKLKAAHARLMRVDPDYAAQHDRNSAPKRRTRSRASNDRDRDRAFAELRRRNALADAIKLKAKLSSVDNEALSPAECDASLYSCLAFDKAVAPNRHRPNNPARPGSVSHLHEPSRRRNHGQVYPFGDDALTLSEIAERTGISFLTLQTRLRRGWSYQRAFTTPKSTNGSAAKRLRFTIAGEELSLKEIAEQTGFSVPTLRSRIAAGWPI